MERDKPGHCHLEAELWADPRFPMEMGWRLLGRERPGGLTQAEQHSSKNSNSRHYRAPPCVRPTPRHGHMLSHSVLQSAFGGASCYRAHFTDEHSEAQKCQKSDQGPADGEERHQCLSLEVWRGPALALPHHHPAPQLPRL